MPPCYKSKDSAKSNFECKFGALWAQSSNLELAGGRDGRPGKTGEREHGGGDDLEWRMLARFVGTKRDFGGFFKLEFALSPV